MSTKDDQYIQARSSVRLITLNNRNCIYCGRWFSPTLARTKEHVIGRRFVPSGSLAGQWNLVAGACKKCNSDKSDLEDDISVISMLPNLHLAAPDPKILDEIARKWSRSTSRRTGKRVSRSDESIYIDASSSTIKMQLKFSAPPQVDDKRIAGLARFHVQAFFYRMSFDEKSGSGRFLTGDFHLWEVAPRSNWGASKIRWFCGLTKTWLPKLRGDGADGNFRVHLRKHSELTILSWALEWNKGFRIMGFVGEPEDIQSLTSNYLREEPAFIHEQNNEIFILRKNTEISADGEQLFQWDDFI